MATFEADVYRAWKGWSDSDFGKFDEALALNFRLELALAEVPLDRSLSVLEIGFGNGAFAGWVRSRGWTFVGTELDMELVARARGNGIEAYGAEADLEAVAKGRLFDLIVAFDVLEHLETQDIIGLLRACTNLLTTGGKLIARFPNGDSPFARAVQYGDVTHKSTIGSGIAVQLATQAGFRVAQLRGPAFPLRGLGIRRGLRRLGVLVVRRIVGSVVNMAFNDNRPLVIDRNIVIVLEPSR